MLSTNLFLRCSTCSQNKDTFVLTFFWFNFMSDKLHLVPKCIPLPFIFIWLIVMALMAHRLLCTTFDSHGLYTFSMFLYFFVTHISGISYILKLRCYIHAFHCSITLNKLSKLVRHGDNLIQQSPILNILFVILKYILLILPSNSFHGS